MNFIYKLFGKGIDDPIEIFKNIPWSKINSFRSDDTELSDIYKKLYILQNEHTSSLDTKQISLVKLYFKNITKKLPKDIIDKIQKELSDKNEINPSIEKAIIPELKSIEPIISKECNENLDCKKIYNDIEWKLLSAFKKDNPKTKETLEKLKYLKDNFIDSFDTNSQQLINLYIKILSKKLDLTTEPKKKFIETDMSNKYCKPFYLDRNDYNCIGTSILSDNDTEKCVLNPNKKIKRNINNIDLDSFCQNNPDYKSKFPQVSL